MGFFRKSREKKKAKAAERNQKCNDLISLLSAAINDANKYIADSNDFVDVSFAERWKNKHRLLFESVNDKLFDELKKAQRIDELKTAGRAAQNISSCLRGDIELHNTKVAHSKIEYAHSLIGNVEGRRLDKQQMLAIVKDAHNHLIIAGAGTGKTTTVVGKIKYMLLTGKCNPEDILVLSFTNASAAEMKARIQKETGQNISASTFHKLGLNIITKAEGVKPRITQINLNAFIREKMHDLMSDPEYVWALGSYLLFNRVAAKSEFDFKNGNEYHNYLRMNPPATIKGETVKSYGEMDIANYLFQNGIRYVYEAAYKDDTRTQKFGQYRPDFYLPDYDIYIEYFGVDKNGNVPAWFSGKNGLTAKNAYHESMQWKRQLHKEKGTILIECFAYEKSDGTLLKNLENNLIKNEVRLSRISSKTLWQSVSRKDNSMLDGVIELFETAINLLKSNNYDIAGFRSMASSTINAARHLDFIRLLEPLYAAYENALKSAGEIDFNDMINIAAKYVYSGKVKNPYSYVIVDEYQDISKARFSLLAALRKSKNYELFSVGDDWQSIYRFAGSDISYILDFENYWGPATFSKIETTYRFSKSLIEISGNFIMRNPRQIEKKIHCNSSDPRFALGIIRGYNENRAFEEMTSIIDSLPLSASVFFIGRYAFDIDIFKKSDLFECKYNNISGLIDVKFSNRPDLKMCFLTAHKAKGLQADYVFIINNKNNRMGFPSKIQDDPILDLLLDKSDSYPFGEERRLFYVALTRAKTKAYLLTEKHKESVFVQELLTQYEEQIKREQYECPVCGKKLRKKIGPSGAFLYCENLYGGTSHYARKCELTH